MFLRSRALGLAKLKVLMQDMLVKLRADTVGRGVPWLSHGVLVVLVGRTFCIAVHRPHPLPAPGGGQVAVEPALQLGVIHMGRVETGQASRFR